MHEQQRQATGGTDCLVVETVDAFFAVLQRMSAHLSTTAAGLGLAYQQAHLVRTLREPVPMRECARGLGLDASNFTGLVDRLEAKGLVERRPDPEDRRVKLVALTGEGHALQARLETLLMAAPPLVAGLEPHEVATLRDLLRRALAAGPTP